MGHRKLGPPEGPKTSLTKGKDQADLPSAATAAAFDATLRHALHDEDLPTARSLVANAEAILAAHEKTSTKKTHPTAMTKPLLASAKARIAMTAGDPVAARAILVQAIERWPEETPLRVMMTEVMLASGRAKDVRPVLTHLGRTALSASTDQDVGSEKKDTAG
jgi:predicted Zn-dependent protease